MIQRILGLILFLSAFAFYQVQVAPSVTAGDSGEFITAAATLSLPHAPSFPLFMLSGRLFSDLLPWGSDAFRLNVFSAFTSALSLLFCFLIGLELKTSRLAALVVALFFGLSTSFWANSLVTEVFSLNTFLTVLLFYVAIRGYNTTDTNKSTRHLFLFAFLMGLGLGNHHILVFAGLSGLALFVSRPDMRQGKTLLVAVLFGLLGFSIYLTLPLRSQKEPPLNWGRPTTPAKLTRTILRRDYGSLRLALEESPPRTLANTARHLKNFGREIAKELSWPVAMLCALGLGFGLWRKSTFAWTILLLFIFSGPFFYVLGNLPFTGQSQGIMGRFYIMPVFFLMLGLFSFGPRLVLLAPVLLFFGAQKVRAMEFDHRHSTLVLDYGRAMLRTMPPHSILFMDGGDDAFYSLAMLHYVAGWRPDVALHDRGGLVFKNPYGDDFRTLTREQKKARRRDVERQYVGVRPLYYSTMDTQVLPGSSLRQRGFLFEVNANERSGADWPTLCLRSLYPTQPADYRTRALAAFFPFMEGKRELGQNHFEPALRYFRRAQGIGNDVEWLKTNLGAEYEKWAYDSLVKGRTALAEWIYLQWLQFDPDSMQANSNSGVAFERQGRLEQAREQYRLTAKRFPRAADAPFNLAVLAWKEEKWNEVVEHLDEVLRRDPNHVQARSYIEGAKQRARMDGR